MIVFALKVWAFLYLAGVAIGGLALVLFLALYGYILFKDRK